MSLPNCTICQPAALRDLIVNEPAMLALWQALPRRHFGPKACLQVAGQPAQRSWLVEQGLVRCYYLDHQGNERNRSFHTTGSWVSAGVPPQVLPSPFSIETMEPTDAVELSSATLLAWCEKFPAIQHLILESMTHVFVSQSRREAELLTLSAQQRYRVYLNDHSALLDRIPMHHAASYLGISNVSLSRIRGQLGMARTSQPT